MTEPTRRKRSLRAAREIGLIVGGALILLSAWWTYRGKFHRAEPITLPLGAVLVLLGLAFPRALVYPNKAWMTLSEALSFVSTRIILAFVFFVIVTPIAFFKRFSGLDPLHRRAAAAD